MLASLTRRLGSMALQGGAGNVSSLRLGQYACGSMPSTLSTRPFLAGITLQPDNGSRYFSTKGKGKGKGNPKAGKSSNPAPAAGAPQEKAVNLQHQAWVQFQKTISVDGYETGATTTYADSSGGLKRRGGKSLRKKMEKMAARREGARADTADLGGGHYPAMRLSDEETKELLAEAYAAIPKRDGKRGTMHLKRMKQRGWRLRQYHIIRKHERIGAHERRMAKRSRIARECREIRQVAPLVRQQEQEYQAIVFQRWASLTGTDVPQSLGSGDAGTGTSTGPASEQSAQQTAN